MKRIISLTVTLTIALLATTSIAIAQVPNQMQYQGYLTDTGGEPLDTTVSMIFRIYDDSTGGSTIWTETHPSVTIEDGLFDVVLGSVNPILDTVFANSERWLGITVGSDSEISPRTKLVTVPYAFRAATVDGGTAGGWVDDGTVVRLETSTDLVGIGTTAPNDKVTVRGTDLYVGTRAPFPSIVTGTNNGGAIYFGVGTTGPNVPTGAIETSWGGTTAPQIGIGVIRDGLKANILMGYANQTWFRRGTTTDMFISSTGNIGIGTTSPAHELDVYGTIFAAHVANDAGIYMDAVGGSYGRIQATNAADNAPKDLVLQPYGGNVGIGTTSPSGKLHVASAGLRSGYFTSDYSSSSTHVIHSEFTGSSTGSDPTAVWGYSRPADDCGYGGIFVGGAGGVVAQVQSTGSAIYFGVDGAVNGGSGTNCGVKGVADGGGTCYGVFGSASGAPGANYGVYGVAPGGGAPNYAGYFNGRLYATSASSGIKAFKIDHPLDPENKYLYHSSVESPDMMNVYNGNVVLDANGEARVELPDYFETVNKDFRYQLTCIGGFAPVYIAQEISGNSFKIAGGESGMKVSWQVTGIRKDPFAEANRIEVEVDKPAQEQGKYLHPEAYGLGEEYGIHYEEHKRMEETRQEGSE